MWLVVKHLGQLSMPAVLLMSLLRAASCTMQCRQRGSCRNRSVLTAWQGIADSAFSCPHTCCQLTSSSLKRQPSMPASAPNTSCPCCHRESPFTSAIACPASLSICLQPSPWSISWRPYVYSSAAPGFYLSWAHSSAGAFGICRRAPIQQRQQYGLPTRAQSWCNN